MSAATGCSAAASVPARGEDWGASIGHQALAAFPEVVRTAVVMAVPHPAATRESLLRAEHVHRSSTGSSSSSRNCRTVR